MAENYKHLYEQTKKMLTMNQDNLIPGFRQKIYELEADNERLRKGWAEAVSAHSKADSLIPRWIPVSERLPEHFGVFIVAIKEPGKERVGKDCADFDPFAKTWLPSMCWDHGYKVTHWMPLPNLPKEEI